MSPETQALQDAFDNLIAEERASARSDALAEGLRRTLLQMYTTRFAVPSAEIAEALETHADLDLLQDWQDWINAFMRLDQDDLHALVLRRA